VTDDWAPEFEPVSTIGADGGPVPGRRRASTRVVFGFVVAGSLIAAAATAAFLAGDDEGTSRPRATTAVTDTSVADVPAPVTPAPATTVSPAWSVVELGVDSPAVPEITEGSWVEWSIEPPGVLAELRRSTEVAVLTADGRLHLIRLPSGDVRSTVVTDVASDGSMALSRDAVAVARFNGLVLLTPTASVAASIRPAEVPDVVSRGDTGEFVVSGGRSSATEPEQRWIVDPAGAVTDVTGGALSEFDPWETRFLASGEFVATGPAGVVAVEVDGTARTLSPGRLVAAGRHHVAVRRCDPSSGCTYHVIDAATGATRPAPLAELDTYRYWDTAARVSPDGRFVLYADWRRVDPSWRLVDLEAASATDLGPLGAIRLADAWAPDSSGVFLIEGEHLVFHPVDGPAAAIVGLGPIRTVATRPATE
jgi:hypothetical protein